MAQTKATTTTAVAEPEAVPGVHPDLVAKLGVEAVRKLTEAPQGRADSRPDARGRYERIGLDGAVSGGTWPVRRHQDWIAKGYQLVAIEGV